MDESPLFNLLLDRSLSHIVVVNAEGEIMFVNDAWVNFGNENECKTSEWKGVNYLEVCEAAAKAGDKTAVLAAQGIRNTLKGTSPQFILEYPCHSPNEQRWFLMRVLSLVIEEKVYFVIYHDRFMSETELCLSKERLALATDAGQVGIWEYDLRDNTLVWDRWMHQLYGTNSVDFSGAYEEWSQSLHPDDIVRAEKQIQDSIYNLSPFDSEFRIITRTGTVRHILAKAKISCDKKGKAIKMVGVNIDITERIESERQIRKLAYYDQLTDLPNRALFADRVNQAIKVSDRLGVMGAILFIDLDEFKKVNDTAGHSTGDSLLQAVALRFQSSLREEDTLCRIGGDEFIVLSPELSKEQVHAVNGAKALAEKLLLSLEMPLILGDYQTKISASIGISLFCGNSVGRHDHSNQEHNQSTYELLLKQADIAMYKAKRSGKNRLCFFDPSLQADVSRRALLEGELRIALAKDELLLYYQPQLDDEFGLVGVEALLRWSHKDYGAISPVEFIIVAEECGLIIPLGDWVIDQACRQLYLWRKKRSFDHLKVSVNISARQLYAPNFVEKIINCVNHYDVDPKLLKLELTESILLEDTNIAVKKMTALAQADIFFTLDDFGTGYSCLSYLKLLPLCVIKIDLSFVKDILVDKNDVAISRTIMALADALGLEVIAEGVEELEQLECLRKMGCHIFQGFYYSKPLSIDKFEEYVWNHR
jgi:diguanylate cyclase (GGDEF)-like protein/PAS domain S-box-containing protein